MSETSPRLSLPYLMAAQAQKHITHNEALQLLDAVVQLSVQSFGAAAPPAQAQEGQVWALPANPSGAWAGKGHHLAAFLSGAWVFISPQEGWRAFGLAEKELRIRQNGVWAKLSFNRVEGLGVGTDFDGANRLAVRSPASLFTHDGAGHQLKINKAGPTGQAALLYQSNWVGRAEMGLLGQDDFALKVSADGQSWRDAMQVSSATGAVTWGGDAATPPGNDLNQISRSGAYISDAATLNRPSSDEWVVFHQRRTAAGAVQWAICSSDPAKNMASRIYRQNAWSSWRMS